MTKKKARAPRRTATRAEDSATNILVPHPFWAQVEKELAERGHDLESLFRELDEIEASAQAEHERGLLELIPGSPPMLRWANPRHDVRAVRVGRAALDEISTARYLAKTGNVAGAQEAARRAIRLLHERALERDARRQAATRKPRERKPAVYYKICEMLRQTPGVSAGDLWRALPKSGQYDDTIYRDGDRLVQVDARTGVEHSMTRKTFANWVARARKDARSERKSPAK